jgi:hypothetical protein
LAPHRRQRALRDSGVTPTKMTPEDIQSLVMPFYGYLELEMDEDANEALEALGNALQPAHRRAQALPPQSFVWRRSIAPIIGLLLAWWVPCLFLAYKIITFRAI